MPSENVKRVIAISVLMVTIGFLISAVMFGPTVTHTPPDKLGDENATEEIEEQTLIREHDYRVFDSDSYQIQLSVKETQNGNTVINESQEYRLSRSDGSVTAIFKVSNRQNTTTQYFDVEEGKVYQSRGGVQDEQYSSQNLTTDFPAFTGREYLLERVPTFEYSYSGTTSDYGGVYEYSIQGFQSNQGQSNTAVSGTLLVSNQNIVRELSFEIQRGDGTTVRQTFVVEKLNEAEVQRPDWVNSSKE